MYVSFCGVLSDSCTLFCFSVLQKVSIGNYGRNRTDVFKGRNKRITGDLAQNIWKTTALGKVHFRNKVCTMNRSCTISRASYTGGSALQYMFVQIKVNFTCSIIKIFSIYHVVKNCSTSSCQHHQIYA